jgi:hypothetical protein
VNTLLIQFHLFIRNKYFYKIFFGLFFSIFTLCSFGQDKNDFKNKLEYLNLLEEDFGIESSKVYYITDSVKSTIISFPSFIYFIRTNEIVTIEQISNTLNTQCMPKKMFKKMESNDISNFFEVNNKVNSLVFKNMKDDNIIRINDEITAVFLFSVHLGKRGMRYIKHIKKMEKDFGLKTIILSLDAPDIQDISDYSKQNQIKIKNKS